MSAATPLPLHLPEPMALTTPLVVATLNTAVFDVWEANARRRVEEMQRKFSKSAALYLPLAPLSFAFSYRCHDCRFFLPENRTCSVVGLPTDFGGERIEPGAWCLLDLPLATQKPFAPLLRLLPARVTPQG